METWQKDHIRKNLPTLIHATVCSTGFLVSLSADGIVSDDDIQILDSISTQMAQAKRLYEIIQTRKDSFNLLKQALKDTAQSGALAILDQCNNPNVPVSFKNCGSISYIRDLLLGKGCFGTRVFKGKFENRDVAVKRLNRDEVEMADVQEEVNLLTLLDSHKNVVRYFKTEVTEDFIFIALELCDINLFDWVAQLQKAIEISTMEVIKQTTEGVAHLHFHRVIHRDLKPSNILLVSRSVGDAQVKISDFGLSKRIPVGASKLNGHTAGVGTVEWMAPEVAGGLSFQNNVAVGMSFASDVFSLGCVYYFVLSGGLHAFGMPPRCQVNIMDGKYELNEQNIALIEGDVSGLIKLISKMIAQERGERPTILDVLARLPEVLTTNGKQTRGQTVDENQGLAGIASGMVPTTIYYRRGFLKTRPFKSATVSKPDTLKAWKCQKPTNDFSDSFEKWHIKSWLFSKQEFWATWETHKKVQLSLTKVNEQNSSQLTKSSRVVKANSGIQVAKWEGEDTREHMLHRAIQWGDMQAIQDLIQLGADVDDKNSKNEAPLMIAATSEVDAKIKYDMLRYLIDHGADAFDRDSEGHTFLHKFLLNTTTFESGIGTFIQYLVDKKLPSLFNIQDITFGTTPLMLAARSVEMGMATILLLRKNGVDLTLVDKSEASYLSYAAEGNKNVKLLAELKKNGDIKHKTLAEAIQAMDLDSVKVLVSLGAEVNKTTQYRRTPLHLAAELNNKTVAINTIKFLIDSGAKVYAKNKFGNIFLHILPGWHPIRNSTINSTQFDNMATYLISKNLSRLFNIPDMNLYTPLHEAVLRVEIERATLYHLKHNGVDLNAADREGGSVLYYATLGNRSLRMISDLVDLGANPVHLTIHKESMLHQAVRSGNTHLVKFFLEKGLDINAQTRRITPLDCAVLCFNVLTPSENKNGLKTVQLLLQNGATSDILDQHMESLRDCFIQNQHKYSEADQISLCVSLCSSCRFG